KTIAQISEDLGFVEDSYFVRIFKQETGETPLKYRKRKNRA
ncbi:helix-turn-helix domain-containing protein, partial [Enterococcus faecalis]